MIKIKEISIAGWKSYDEEGICLSDLKEFNLIIGPNNTGKSNLLHYFKHICYDFPFDDCYKEWRKGLNSNCSKENTWNLMEGEVKSSIKIEDLKTNEILELELTETRDKEAKFKVSRFKREKNDLANKEYYQENSKEAYKYWKMLMDKFDHIVPQRDYNRFSNSSTIGFDGSQLVNDLDNLQPKQVKDLLCFLTMCLTEILGEEIKVKKIEILPMVDLNLDRYRAKIKDECNCDERLRSDSVESVDQLEKVAQKERRIKFTIEQGREKQISLDLNDLGTGITQIVIILCYLFLRTKIEGHENLILFIEEPESNLHSDTLIKFMKLLENKFQHQLFVTTHSNALLDCLSTSSSVIYRVKKTSKGSSEFSACLKDLEKFYLLDDLGVTASQLLLSNYVIWVEGPSDRIYLKKWIEGRSSLRENEHFIFAMYGGRNLHSYTLLNKENLGDWIKILKSSRYIAVVADSDGTSVLKPEKDYKNTLTPLKRIKNEINMSDELKDFCYVWITYGKEIENYIPRELLKKAVMEIHNTRKYKRNEKFLPAKFERFNSFSEYLANMYRTEKGRKLNKDQKKVVKSLIANKKVPIAYYVAKNWDDKYYKDNKELTNSLIELIKCIKKANKMG